MPTALIKFTQGATVGTPGVALKLTVADGNIVVTNGSNTGVGSWEIRLLDKPPGSALALGVLAQANGASPTCTITPDASGGCLRVQLKVWAQANQQGLSDLDIRCVGFNNSAGVCPPPAQVWPLPLPDPQSGRTTAKPNECNFDGALQGGSGWAGDGLTDGLVTAALRMIGGSSGGGTSNLYFGSGSDGNLTASSGTTTLTKPTYYDTVTLTGTAKIDAKFPLFIKVWNATGTPPASAIFRSGVDGTSGTNLAIGVPCEIGGNLGGSSASGSGGGGGAPNVVGFSGIQATSIALGIGGVGGAGGAGGAGSGGKAGGAGGAIRNLTLRAPQQTLQQIPMICTNTLGTVGGLLFGGTGGGGGGGGGGAPVSNSGGAGRGGGSGGPVLELWVGELITDGTTPAGLVNSYGGTCGTAAGTPANGGGSGGGGGGGGGATRVFVGKRTGSPVTNLVCANGGAGGPGGLANIGTAGTGGQAGGGGSVLAMVLDTGVVSYLEAESGGGPLGIGTAGGVPSVWGLTV